MHTASYAALRNLSILGMGEREECGNQWSGVTGGREMYCCVCVYV